VQGLSGNQAQSGAYALILAEENGTRRIPIIVGTPEAQSIAVALEHIIPQRPLTHDLFVTFGKTMGLRLKEVFIHRFEDGIFYSELIYEKGRNEIRLDSRTSDAIAIALRVDCNIYTTEQIVKECGLASDELTGKDDGFESYLLDFEPEDIKDDKQLKRWLSLLDPDELQGRMEDAITDENYEYAKMYKDELKRRGKNR
jgi:bifunctional DNase/RNase